MEPLTIHLSTHPPIHWQTFAAVAILGLLLLALPAGAHTAKCFACVEGDQVVGYAWVGGGNRVKHAHYEVHSPDGTLLHEGETADDGTFSFRPSVFCDHQIRVEAGEGHAARFTVRAEDLPGVKPGESAAPAGGDRGEHPLAPDPAVHRLPADLGQSVAEVISREIAPLRRDLAELKSQSDFRDLVAGVGFIVGITGVVFYILARKQTSQQKANG